MRSLFPSLLLSALFSSAIVAACYAGPVETTSGGSPNEPGGEDGGGGSDGAPPGEETDGGDDAAVTYLPPRPLPEAGGPAVCTSNETWSSDDTGPTMNPGRACITCHVQEKNNPILQVGGTVYPTLHEPDLCYGAGGIGAEVIVTDANGREVRLPVGPTGNFSLRARGERLVMPIRAKVVYEGRAREMNSAQMTGDCNGCHTERGLEGAPGRIVLP